MKPILRDIVDISLSNPALSTVSRAFVIAGLAKQFSSAGPFTFFAPNDDAFHKLSPEDYDALMGDAKRLAEVLKYHTLRGALKTWDLPSGNATTLEGSSIHIGATDDGMTFGHANMAARNIPACNGVLHVVDAVMMPWVAKAVTAPLPESAWSGQRRAPPRPRSW